MKNVVRERVLCTTAFILFILLFVLGKKTISGSQIYICVCGVCMVWYVCVY